jgi:formate/nitrite transporter FocA (FNT family)
MRLSPDELIFWQHGFLKLNGTIVFTWALILALVIGSKLVTLSPVTSKPAGKGRIKTSHSEVLYSYLVS